MPIEYSTQSVCYPHFQAINYRFVVHVAAVSQSSGSSPDGPHHNSTSPASSGYTRCHLPDSTSCMEERPAKQLQKPAAPLRKPRVHGIGGE